MSTRSEPTYDDATTTSPPTDSTTDFSGTEPRPIGGDRPTGEGTPVDDTAWTDRCGRQFATTDTARLRNLTDDENAAMHDGV